MICMTCGTSPCLNPTFCVECRKPDSKLAAERKARRQRVSDAIMRARRLLDPAISLDRAHAEINDRRGDPTPQVTIEAVLHCVRERGLVALKEPANIERLTRCDAAARAQINKRIERLRSKAMAHD